MKTSATRTGLFALVFSLGVLWLQYHLYGKINKAWAPADRLVQQALERLN